MHFCCFMGPQQLLFYCNFKKEFLEILGFVLFYGTQFFSNKLSKIWYIFGIFFSKKSMFFASKSYQMERFWRTLMKSPIEHQKFEISENLAPPNFLFFCIFKKEILAEYVVLWLKKPILCCCYPQRIGPPENISGNRYFPAPKAPEKIFCP